MTPISFIEKRIPGALLIPGFRAGSVHFSYKTRDKRRPERQEYFDKIIVSIWRFGLVNPLITYKGRILVGMSRWEIMIKFDPLYIFDCWEILEAVEEWNRYDLDRLDTLKKHYESISNWKEIWDK
ncbi:hypothetical protein LCGC14_0359110 [marine sediment metagenome]|uniref:ParB/Sulfiredoxin domain-containing protein n=1 Tax=marine sediment metagenome TaxID=412755 RepID=A0A0F9VVM5_9ZZZZ|nr:hypothetical protein [Candidatus Aminicenantes bacterium]